MANPNDKSPARPSMLIAAAIVSLAVLAIPMAAPLARTV